MAKRNHPLTVGEKVYDDSEKKWGIISLLSLSPEEGGNVVVIKGENGELWEALESDVYQIALGFRTACSGDIVCYEHNETQDDYPYYCPALEENFFEVELIQTLDKDLAEGTAYELVQRLQDAVLSCKNIGVPVFVEDENGRLENITHIWYDQTRGMIRLTVSGVEFEDAPEA